eukprot:391734_1
MIYHHCQQKSHNTQHHGSHINTSHHSKDVMIIQPIIFICIKRAPPRNISLIATDVFANCMSPYLNCTFFVPSFVNCVRFFFFFLSFSAVCVDGDFNSRIFCDCGFQSNFIVYTRYTMAIDVKSTTIWLQCMRALLSFDLLTDKYVNSIL